MIECDFLIIGAGVIGLSVAHSLQSKYKNSSILIIEKESDVALHASGRNSGVLHAGFYYTADSLKAKFTLEGNQRLKEFCYRYQLPVNECGKVVVTKDESELEGLYELKKRGDTNGVELYLIDQNRLLEIEPNAKTYKEALYSPNTATVNPTEVVKKLRDIVVQNGAKLYTNTQFKHNIGLNTIETNQGKIRATKIINTAGLYADKIASSFGFGDAYTIIPFKGIYLRYSGKTTPIKTNIYPVPKLENPFLGVHYTLTVDGTTKIGPTAIPAFWRENYDGFSNFNIEEMIEILYYETKLFATDSFHFRKLAFEEFQKYSPNKLVSLAQSMVKSIEKEKFDSWSKPGIRAQLLHKESLELVQDFVVEGDNNSVHILNAVSPAFTCSFAFSEWIVNQFID